MNIRFSNAHRGVAAKRDQIMWHRSYQTNNYLKGRFRFRWKYRRKTGKYTNLKAVHFVRIACKCYQYENMFLLEVSSIKLSGIANVSKTVAEKVPILSANNVISATDCHPQNMITRVTTARDRGHYTELELGSTVVHFL